MKEDIKLNEIESTEVTERDNLAVVARVSKLEPIEGKDFVELVHLDGVGFTFICEKIHKVGDLVVYVKYDSIVPDNELFEFMRESKFRVKPKAFTMKDLEGSIVGKVYSQGIVLPLTKVVLFLEKETNKENEGSNLYTLCSFNYDDGRDFSSLLGVTKWIPKEVGSGSSFGVMSSRGDFPVHLCSKTDEVNGASKSRVVDEIQGMDVYITLKQEGSSLTCLWDDSRDELIVCSRNNIIGYHETNKFWLVVNKHNLQEKLSNNKHLIIQGELVGPGVQKNKLGLSEVDIRVFNVIDRTKGRERLPYEEFKKVVIELDLPFVDIMAEIKGFNWDFDQLQEYADIMKYLNGEVAEGIVVRSMIPCYSQVLKGDLSFKIINRNYKL